ncbi:hypothetical protein [Fusobacterium sp.]|uniref:hypothetical protein n=1 Tax=Fusobacterium sp. TaxID=68766 RepID=UPI0028FFEFAC|nr:hypothetical protein [Fusobacterium sp.]MDU1912445.1 hypothetical protein [Fusobacterium sp.]
MKRKIIEKNETQIKIKNVLDRKGGIFENNRCISVYVYMSIYERRKAWAISSMLFFIKDTCEFSDINGGLKNFQIIDEFRRKYIFFL